MRIGIDVGGTKIEAIALSESGDILYRERRPTPADDYNAVLETIANLVDAAEAAAGTKSTVGVGIPGSISNRTGLIKNANTQCLIGKPMQSDLLKKLDRPVRCSNDANCMAVSEAVDGAAQGYGFVLAIIIGTGCGGGIAVNGQAHNGRNLVAGEIGHVTLPWITAEELADSEKCYCGFRGCNESWVSGTGFERDYERHTGKELTAPEIIRQAEAGETAALENLLRYENRLARLCAQNINIMDPDIIVLAGGMSNIDRLYETVPPQLEKYVFGNECNTPIVRAKHGDSSGVRGAAWLWPVE